VHNINFRRVSAQYAVELDPGVAPLPLAAAVLRREDVPQIHHLFSTAARPLSGLEGGSTPRVQALAKGDSSKRAAKATIGGTM